MGSKLNAAGELDISVKMESQNIKDTLLQLNLHIQVQSLYPLFTYVSSDASTPFIQFADNSWLNPR